MKCSEQISLPDYGIEYPVFGRVLAGTDANQVIEIATRTGVRISTPAGLNCTLKFRLLQWIRNDDLTALGSGILISYETPIIHR